MNYSFVSNEWAYVLSNATVSNGTTVTVPSNAHVVFGNDATLTSYGRLDISGASFTALSGTSYGSWGSIVLSGSGANNSTFDYLDLTYGTDIEILNASNVTIQNSSIQNTVNGIYGYYASGLILNNTITNVRDHGVNLIVAPFTCNQNTITKTSGFGDYQSGGAIICQSGSSGYLWKNDISGYNWGIGAIWGSSPAFYNSNNNYQNNNIINCLNGIMAYQESWPLICPTSGPNINYYRGNSIHDNDPCNIYFTSGGTLYAGYTYWGGTPPINFCTGTVDYTGYLGSDPWGQAEEIAGNVPKLSTQSSGQGKTVSLNAGASLIDGIQLRMQNKYREAKDFFLAYISKNPDDQAAYVELYNCYNDQTATDIISFFKSLPKGAAKEQELLLANLYVWRSDIVSAKKVNDRLSTENPNTALWARGKLNNFYIALYNENDPVSAATILSDVQSKSELSTLMELSTAQDALESYQRRATVQPSAKSAVVPPVQSRLSQNYPNPFNPVTTITYAISRPGRVSLKVFDILGRQVASIVNDEKTEGVYTTKFDASHLSSGIYFYQLTAPGVNETRKMLIAK